MDRFDDDVQTLIEQCSRLSRISKSALFLASAKRLEHLYTDYCVEVNFNSGPKFKALVSDVELALAAETVKFDYFKNKLNWIDSITPDEEGSLKATLAQDACICLANSINFLVNDDRARLELLDSNLEAIRAAICFDRWGYIDIPDNERYHDLVPIIMNDERYIKERRRIERDIIDCERIGDVGQLVPSILARAQDDAWTYKTLIII